eukprot:COSAG01_NODE_57892_length_309_cov_1.038095_1_plen_54_part_01
MRLRTQSAVDWFLNPLVTQSHAARSHSKEILAGRFGWGKIQGMYYELWYIPTVP